MKKAFIIIAVVLVVAGLAVMAGVMIAVRFDFGKFKKTNTVTNTYAPEGNFTSVDIDTDTADILLLPSDDGKLKVVCEETEKIKHSVTVEDSVLLIKVEDTRDWTDRFMFFADSMKITVYLPAGKYESIKIREETGDVSLPSDFSFGDIDIKISTGNVDCSASADGEIGIETSTGNITLSGTASKSAVLKASTGHVSVKGAAVSEGLSVRVSTGKTTVSDSSCGSFETDGSTGRLTMRNFTSGSFNIERGTGDVIFEDCDAGEIRVKTSTGDVTGTLRTGKNFITGTSTGSVSLPASSPDGGRCEIRTSTGDIAISVSKS